ncbi:MAG: hypothetical protein V3V64_11000 [Acidiferrobacterales bacterium]
MYARPVLLTTLLVMITFGSGLSKALAFLPAQHLESGFPVREQDMVGARRQLLDYKTGVDVAPGLFALPRDYRRFTLNDMRVR